VEGKDLEILLEQAGEAEEGPQVRVLGLDDMPDEMREQLMGALEGAVEQIDPLAATLMRMLRIRAEAARSEGTAAGARAAQVRLERQLERRRALVLRELLESGDLGRNAEERDINKAAALVEDDPCLKLQDEWDEAEQAAITHEAHADSLHRQERMLASRLRALMEHRGMQATQEKMLADLAIAGVIEYSDEEE
jgi:hypothetical protein